MSRRRHLMPDYYYFPDKDQRAEVVTGEQGAKPALPTISVGASEAESFDVVVIGGGQAGLSVGYHLSYRNARFVILDASPRVGDSWRNRWNSLRLFSPARYDALDGMKFPAPGDAFPTK